MATKQASSSVHVDEEDYIDMELSSSSSSSSNFISYSIGSPSQNNKEFEFQMTSVSNQKESTTSPADDLFYKGKLLPLLLPPRLQMVQNLLENPINNNKATLEDGNFPFTPLESCNISPSESRRVSSSEVINPDEFLFEWSSSEMSGFVVGGDVPKKSNWSKKLKQIKHFWKGQSLKNSRAYLNLRSLFSKSGCSDKYDKVARKKNLFEIFDDNKKQSQAPCSVMKNMNGDLFEDGFNNHRRSFSGVIQRHCAIKSSSLSTSSSGSSSSSSSFSFSSAGYYDLQLFKRSISAYSELESSIEGAIAHCKKSQKQCCPKKNNEDGNKTCSQFASKIAACGRNQEMAALESTRG